MDSKLKKVHDHFNHVNRYLNKRFDIKLRAQIVKELIGTPENADILDLGCGDGSISLQFQSKTNFLTLVDISESMLQCARENILPDCCDQVSLCHSDVVSFSPPKRYDLIIGIGLLAHVESVQAMIKKMSMLLKRNGYCLLQITDQNQIFTKILNSYNDLLDKVTGQFGYKRHKLFLTDLINTCNAYDLVYEKSIQYSLMVPGATYFFPDQLLYTYHSKIKNSSFLSSKGTDFIIRFKKRGN